MRAILILSTSLSMLGSAQASSLLSLPVAQDAPSVITLGPDPSQASVTASQPATDDETVSSIGEQSMRYDAPVVIDGGMDPQPQEMQPPQGGPPPARSAPLSSGQMADRAEERAARAEAQGSDDTAPVVPQPVTPGIVQPRSP